MSSVLEFKSTEAHHCHSHEADGYEGYSHALERLGNVAVFHLLAYGSEHDDGERPTQSAADGIGYAVANAGDGLRVVDWQLDALLHEERGAHDGAVDGDKRQENAQRRVERWRELLHGHLHELHYSGNDGDEENEA